MDCLAALIGSSTRSGRIELLLPVSGLLSDESSAADTKTCRALGGRRGGGEGEKEDEEVEEMNGDEEGEKGRSRSSPVLPHIWTQE